MADARSAIVWSQSAQRDLLDIWEHFARVASADTADRLLDDIEMAADRLSLDPRMHQLRLDLMELPGGLRSFAVHPYMLFYRIEPHGDAPIKEVQILRVLHERRDFDSLLAREE